MVPGIPPKRGDRCGGRDKQGDGEAVEQAGLGERRGNLDGLGSIVKIFMLCNERTVLGVEAFKRDDFSASELLRIEGEGNRYRAVGLLGREGGLSAHRLPVGSRKGGINTLGRILCYHGVAFGLNVRLVSPAWPVFGQELERSDDAIGFPGHEIAILAPSVFHLRGLDAPLPSFRRA